LIAALNNWKKLINGATLARLFSLRQEFSAEWNRFFSPAAGQPKKSPSI
jgi:hypothetical protein